MHGTCEICGDRLDYATATECDRCVDEDRMCNEIERPQRRVKYLETALAAATTTIQELENDKAAY